MPKPPGRGRVGNKRGTRGEILTFPDTPTSSGVISMVFQHSGGRDFDLPTSQTLPRYSGVISMVFQHSGGRDFDLPRHSHYSGVISMVFQHSGGGWGKNGQRRSQTVKSSLCSSLRGHFPCSRFKAKLGLIWAGLFTCVWDSHVRF